MMSRFCLTALLALASSTFLLATCADAQAVLQTEGSGVNQYTETMPSGGGNEPTGKSGGPAAHSPATHLGKANAAHLEALGPEGKAAADLAAAGAPEGTDGDSGRPGNDPDADATEPVSSPHHGSSGPRQIVGQLTGTTSSGGMGLLFPVLICLVTLSAAAFLLARRRMTSAKHG